MAEKVTRLGAARMDAFRMDDLHNVLSGMGEEGRDLTASDVFRRSNLGLEYLKRIYRGSHTAARVCEVFPEHMFQEGWTLTIPGEDSGKAQDVKDMVDELLEFDERFKEGMSWANAHGGSALVLGAEDGGDWSQELDVEKVDTFDWVNLLTNEEIRPVSLYPDVMAKKFGQPMLYEIGSDLSSEGMIASSPFNAATFGAGVGLNRGSVNETPRRGAVLVHESRIIRFDGVRLPRRQMLESNIPGWGDSVLERAWEHVQRFDAAHQNLGRLLRTYQQRILKILGLSELVVNPDNIDLAINVILRRAAAVAKSSDVANMVVIDEKEAVEYATGSLGGVPESIDRLTKRVAAAADTPVSIFLGEMPSGLNASGEQDTLMFFAKVASKQRRIAQPRLERIVRLCFLAKNGPTKGVEPEDWTIEFGSLHKLSQVQIADRNLKQSTADKNWTDAGWLTETEGAESRFPDSGLSLETRLDKETRAAMADLQTKAAEADLQRQIKGEPDPNAPQPGGFPPGGGPKPTQPPARAKTQDESDPIPPAWGGFTPKLSNGQLVRDLSDAQLALIMLEHIDGGMKDRWDYTLLREEWTRRGKGETIADLHAAATGG